MHVPHRFSGIGTPAPLLSRPPAASAQPPQAPGNRAQQARLRHPVTASGKPAAAPANLEAQVHHDRV